MQAIRAIYQNGQLRLLDPVQLDEGQEIQVMIVSDKNKVHEALGDLLVEIPADEDDLNEELLLQEIEKAFYGLPPLSQVIIDERHEDLYYKSQ